MVDGTGIKPSPRHVPPKMPKPSQAFMQLRRRLSRSRSNKSASDVKVVLGSQENGAPNGAPQTAPIKPEDAIIDLSAGEAPVAAPSSAPSPASASLISPDPSTSTHHARGGSGGSEASWRVVETPPPHSASFGALESQGTVVTPENVTAALEDNKYLLPRRFWDQPDTDPILRGANYLEDSKKEPMLGGPLTTLFAAQAFELEGEHIAGTSACLLQRGSLIPPRDAKFVLTLHYMNPRPSRGAKYNALLLHFYATKAAEEFDGPSGELLKELWSGDGAYAVTRAKILATLRSGPHLVRAVMSWLGLDDTRPMLMARQVNMSINRATLPHRGAGGAGSSSSGAASSSLPSEYQHCEVGLDLAASPLSNQIYRYGWPALASVDISVLLVQEGRSAEELPEHHLAAFTICHLDPAEVGPTPPEWPSTSADIPGELIGSYASGRDGKEPLSWQSTRAILADEKGKKSHRRLWSKG